MTTITMTSNRDDVVLYARTRLSEGATEDEVASEIKAATMYRPAKMIELAKDDAAFAADNAQYERKQAEIARSKAIREAKAAKTAKAGRRTVRRRVTEDDASIYGYQYLGHEGEYADFPSR